MDFLLAPCAGDAGESGAIATAGIVGAAVVRLAVLSVDSVVLLTRFLRFPPTFFVKWMERISLRAFHALSSRVFSNVSDNNI